MDWKEYWNRPGISALDAFKQVGRTFQQKNYSETTVEILVNRLATLLRPSPDQALLELACGNGMITSRLAPLFQRVTAVDFSQELLAVARNQFAGHNIEYVYADATDLAFVQDHYDSVLVNFAFQYFTPHQARQTFKQLKRVVKPHGRIVLGDVADGDRMWKFYRGFRGRSRYAFDQVRRRPIIGHWWTPAALSEIADEMGWELSIFYQPRGLPNYYFRYDAVLELSD